MSVYIGGSVNSGPSDQTDLKGRRRCNLESGGEPTFEGEANQGAHRLVGWPHLAVPWPLPWWVAPSVFWNLLVLVLSRII